MISQSLGTEFQIPNPNSSAIYQKTGIIKFETKIYQGC